MQVNTIVELSKEFRQEDISKFLSLMQKEFDISDKELKVYEAKKYAYESDFTNKIYNDISVGLEESILED